MKIEKETIGTIDFYDSQLETLKLDEENSTLELSILYLGEKIAALLAGHHSVSKVVGYFEKKYVFKFSKVSDYSEDMIAQILFKEGGKDYHMFKSDQIVCIDTLEITADSFKIWFNDSFGVRDFKYKKVEIELEITDCD
jgi:hypothetical protein